MVADLAVLRGVEAQLLVFVGDPQSDSHVGELEDRHRRQEGERDGDSRKDELLPELSQAPCRTTLQPAVQPLGYELNRLLVSLDG